MAALKLGKLPDRTPVKLTVAISPDLKRALDDYAKIYCDVYGVDEPVSELVPHMLESFLAADRSFLKARSGLQGTDR